MSSGGMVARSSPCSCAARPPRDWRRSPNAMIGIALQKAEGLTPRSARPDDAAAIARIYSEGIADRIATFEADPRSEDDVRAWFTRSYPIIVVEHGGVIIAFASSSSS